MAGAIPDPQTENEMNTKFLTATLLAAMLLPGLAFAQSATRATFEVTKIFADGNDEAEITVSIDCNTGLILDQDKDLQDGDTVEFVVTDYDDGELNCTIEEDGTSGYSAEYLAEGTGGTIEDSSVCEFTEIAGVGEFFCEITNEPDAVEIEVTKEWVIEGDNNNVDLYYQVHLYCDSVYVSAEQQTGDVYIGWDEGEGPGSDTHTFNVQPSFPSSSCWVEESVYDSAIEVDNGCGSLTVSAGVGASCTITNSVFFEGIPTLSQYGMAIMALLMLGVGFVGFRRFA
jgi:hypothetical protein